MNLEYFKSKIEPLVESVEQNHKTRIEDKISEYKRDISRGVSGCLEFDVIKEALQDILAQHEEIENKISSLEEKLSTIYGHDRQIIINEINVLNSKRLELDPPTIYRTKCKIASLNTAKSKLIQEIQNIETRIEDLRSTQPTFSSKERDMFEEIVREFNRFSKQILKKHRGTYLERYRIDTQNKISTINSEIYDLELIVLNANVQKHKYTHLQHQLSEHEAYIYKKDVDRKIVTQEDIEILQKLKKDVGENIGLDTCCIVSHQNKIGTLKNQVLKMQHAYNHPIDTFEFFDEDERNTFNRGFNKDIEFDIIAPYLVEIYNRYVGDVDKRGELIRSLKLTNGSSGLRLSDFSILLDANGKVKILK